MAIVVHSLVNLIETDSQNGNDVISFWESNATKVFLVSLVIRDFFSGWWSTHGKWPMSSYDLRDKRCALCAVFAIVLIRGLKYVWQMGNTKHLQNIIISCLCMSLSLHMLFSVACMFYVLSFLVSFVTKALTEGLILFQCFCSCFSGYHKRSLLSVLSFIHGYPLYTACFFPLLFVLFVLALICAYFNYIKLPEKKTPTKVLWKETHDSAYFI